MAIALRSSRQISYPIPSTGALTATLAVREAGPAGAPKPRLLDRVREAIRARHYSRRTEKAYFHWIKRFIFFHGKRPPAEMGAAEVTAFLTLLAVHGAHIERVREQHQADPRHGAGWVDLPGALTRKYPNAGRDRGWQWCPSLTFNGKRRSAGRKNSDKAGMRSSGQAAVMIL
jgi:hypothetical protein